MINVFLDLDFSLLEAFGQAEQFGHLIEFLNPILNKSDVEIYICNKLAEDLQDDDIEFYLGDNVTSISPIIVQAEIWQNHMIQDTSCQYNRWDLGSALPVSESVYADMAERIQMYDSPCLYIVRNGHNAFPASQEYIYVLRDDKTLNPNQSHFISIPLVRFFDSGRLNLLLNAYRANRIFKHNPKHDRRKHRLTRRGGMKVDRLLCTEQRAQELLLNALKDESPFPKTPKLFNVDRAIDDADNERIYVIEFMPSSDGTYHAYHLEDIEDTGDLSREEYSKYIPNELRNKIIERWKRLE